MRLCTDQGPDGQLVLVLEERAGPLADPWGALQLTPREREVAQLLARGHSASEIAERLVVSVRPVEKHLEHIYAKLEVRTASAARARIARQLRRLA